MFSHLRPSSFCPSKLSIASKRWMATSSKKGIIQRLEEGIVIGDGGFVFALEKRGYCKAGPWTPEATVEFPEAVKQLHREFARSGSDVMQTFTFYASEDKLENRGNYAAESFGTNDINVAACNIAREVANEYGGLFAGGICQTPTYLSNIGKAATKAQFKKQCDIFKRECVDFMIVEYYEHIEECEWAIETVQEEMPGTEIAATLCINHEGDLHEISTGDCALRIAEKGARIIGLNCHFDPFITLRAIEKMKDSLDKFGLMWDKEKNPNGVFLMAQPVGYMTPDVSKQGFIDLPEFPFALEPRICTRWDMHKYARMAHELGVKYIGGCCGFEPYHIRAVAEELMEERGGPNSLGDASKKHEQWGGGLEMHTKPWVRARAKKEYWQNIQPSSGRPHSASYSEPDQWGVTQGDEKLKQKKARGE
eukprot:211369_1